MFVLRTLHCSESSCWECDLDSDGVTVWHWDRWHALTWHNLSSLKIITSSLHCFMAFNCHFRNWKRQSTSFHCNSLVAYFRTGRTSLKPSYCNIVKIWSANARTLTVHYGSGHECVDVTMSPPSASVTPCHDCHLTTCGHLVSQRWAGVV